LFTGASDGRVEDLADKINIVAPNADDDGSRIVHSMHQSEGSEILAPPADETSSPWLARARSNLQIMYRTALAVSHTLDIDQLLARIMDMIFEWVDADRAASCSRISTQGNWCPRCAGIAVAWRATSASPSVKRFWIMWSTAMKAC
jgi:hypothetical protein